MSADVKLRVVVESSGLQPLKQQFKETNDEAERGKKKLKEYEDALKQNKKAAQDAAGGLRDFTKSIRDAINPLNLLRAGLGAVFAGVTIAAIAKTADEMASLDTRMRQASRTAEEYKATFDSIKKTSLQTGQSLKDTGQVFLRFQMGLAGIGRSNAEVAKLTDIVSKLGVVSGATSVEIRESLRQLAQGMSSGVLQGDELRSIKEAMPPLAQAIADGMGVAVGSLKKLGSEGKITSQVIYDALASQAAKIEERFKNMPLTIGRSLGMVAASWDMFIGAFDNATGISQAFAQSIKAVSDGLLWMAQNIDQTVSAVAQVAAGIVGFTATVTVLTALLTGVFNPALAGLVVSIGAAALAVGALASQITGYLMDAFQTWMKNNKALAQNNVSMVTVIAAAMQKLPRIAEAVGYSIADAFQNGMMMAANAVARFVNYAGNQLLNLARKLPKGAQDFLGMNLTGAKFDKVPFAPGAFRRRGQAAFGAVNNEIVGLAVSMTKQSPFGLSIPGKGGATGAGGGKAKKGPKASDATAGVFESARNLYNDTALALEKNEDKLKSIVDYTKQLGTLGLEGAKRWKAEQEILNEYNQKAKELAQKRIDLERKLQQAIGKNATTKGGVKGSANIAATRELLNKIKAQEAQLKSQGPAMVLAERGKDQNDFLQKLREEAQEKSALLAIDAKSIEIMKQQGDAAAALYVEREKLRLSIEKAAGVLGLSADDPRVKQAVKDAQDGATGTSVTNASRFAANFERETAYQRELLSLKEQAKQKERELGQYEAERWLAIQQRVLEYRKQFQEMGLNPDQFQGQIEQRARVDVENSLTTVGNKLTSMQQLFQGLKSTIGQTFMDMVTGASNAKTAMIGLLRAIATELIKVFALQALTGFVKGGGKAGSWIGKIFGIGTSSPAGNALGGVYSGGVKRFAKGGVVNGTTLFGTRDGLGMMGEAGPEAIMPLVRGRNGALGVQAFGGGGNVVLNAPITINIQSSGQGDTNSGQLAAQIGKSVQDSLRVTIQEELMNQMRPGGILNATPF